MPVFSPDPNPVPYRQPISYGVGAAPGLPPTVSVVGRRPGLVTAIGVVSIVVAGLSLAAGAVSGLAALSVCKIARVSAGLSSAGRSGPAGGTPLVALPSPDELGADVSAARRARADRRAGMMDLIASIRPLSPAVRRQLDGMLARHGEQVLPRRLLAADEVSTADLREEIEAVGRPPGAGPDEEESLSITFRSTGRLDLTPDRALFVPTGGAGRRLAT
ncbi:MAG: hypothetical protein JWO31_3606, partial [Phycisphaerales bacterium]|nr:hypothetical protein [Phycisphaerales bacterium]